jgi:hypothetical protein
MVVEMNTRRSGGIFNNLPITRRRWLGRFDVAPVDRHVGRQLHDRMADVGNSEVTPVPVG